MFFLLLSKNDKNYHSFIISSLSAEETLSLLSVCGRIFYGDAQGGGIRLTWSCANYHRFWLGAAVGVRLNKIDIHQKGRRKLIHQLHSLILRKGRWSIGLKLLKVFWSITILMMINRFLNYSTELNINFHVQ